jgi:hypothetical protein
MWIRSGSFLPSTSKPMPMRLPSLLTGKVERQEARL